MGGIIAFIAGITSHSGSECSARQVTQQPAKMTLLRRANTWLFVLVMSVKIECECGYQKPHYEIVGAGTFKINNTCRHIIGGWELPTQKQTITRIQIKQWNIQVCALSESNPHTTTPPLLITVHPSQIDLLLKYQTKIEENFREFEELKKKQMWCYYRRIQLNENSLLIILIITTLGILGHVWYKKVGQRPKEVVAGSVSRVKMGNGRSLRT